MDRNTAPGPLLRPKLAQFLWERGLSAPNVASVLGCTSETVRRYCLPFSDGARIVPGRKIMARIVAYTDGQVTAADFYPPELNGRAVQPGAALQSGAAQP